MAKFTLLDMTQNILSRMSSDEVNSISDSPESLQVATIIKNKYFDIVNRINLPDHDQLVQLDPSIDPSSPNLMYVPAGIADIKWLKYFNTNVLSSANVTNIHAVNTNIVPTPLWTTTSVTSNTIALGAHTFTVTSSTLPVIVGQTITATSGVNNMTGTVTSYVGTTLGMNTISIVGSGTFTTWSITATSQVFVAPGYTYVTILPVDQFIETINGFNPGETNVRTMTFADTSNNFPGNYKFYYKNDRQPCYCTIISNFYVIFDSYDNTQDSTLQSSKSMAWGRVIPRWTMVDNFTPDLAEEQFQLLLNEATALAFFELKQQPHQLAAQEASRGWSNIQKNKAVTNRPTYFNELPNYGRHSGSYNGRKGFNQVYNQWQ